MKIIKYKFLSATVNHGTEEEPIIEQIILEKMIPCRTQEEYDRGLLVAKQEAIAGTLDPDHDGMFEPEESATEERITELEAALDLLLSGVTE